MVHSVHMMHQFAHLAEQRVQCLLGFYLSQHPECAQLPLEAVLQCFRAGANDLGFLESHLPNLTSVMCQIPNTKEKWFAERLCLESLSRDLGEPNLFMTLNMDPRAWPDVRELVYQLEHGPEKEMDKDWYVVNADLFSVLMSKHAVQASEISNVDSMFQLIELIIY